MSLTVLGADVMGDVLAVFIEQFLELEQKTGALQWWCIGPFGICLFGSSHGAGHILAIGEANPTGFLPGRWVEYCRTPSTVAGHIPTIDVVVCDIRFLLCVLRCRHFLSPLSLAHRLGLISIEDAIKFFGQVLTQSRGKLE